MVHLTVITELCVARAHIGGMPEPVQTVCLAVQLRFYWPILVLGEAPGRSLSVEGWISI